MIGTDRATNRTYESLHDVPETLLPKWQQTVDLMAQVYDVPAGAITRRHSQTHKIEALLTSETGRNPYHRGACVDLGTGHYCETVMTERRELHVINALEDPLWNQNPDIEIGLICYLGVPLLWPDNTVFGTICVLDVRSRDFSSAYKELMWKFKEIIESDLRFLVELRRREQAEEELRHATQLAEAANQAKSMFLASMSHELRTPLNAILGFTQLMNRSRELPPELRDNLGIIRRSGEHLLNLINNVLDLSKIEAGHMSLNETGFNLHNLLDELEDMFQLRASEKHLALTFQQTPDVPRYIATDQVKLRQVLINLLSNALKFTHAGGITLRVSTGTEDTPPRPGDQGHSSGNGHQTPGAAPDTIVLHFAVEDSGPGIAPDEQARIFEPFTQTSTGQQAQEGTGLGLPISRRFVQLMGGDMTVRSAVGHGACFQFSLRAHLVEAAAVEQRSAYRQVIGLAPDQPTYRILVADDRWSNRQLLLQLLAPLGFEICEARNGQEAVDLCETWHPHLIWMDMRMPVMDGYEATRHIKATTKGQATAVIALTASTLEEERAVVLSTGCDDFVRKPFDESEIFNTMQKHIGVRYIYQEPEPSDEGAGSGAPVLTSALLTEIPPALLASLEQALLTTNPDMIDQVIDEVRSHHPTIAQSLATLAHDFEYTRMLTLLQLTHRA